MSLDLDALQSTFAEQGYVVLRNLVAKGDLSHFRDTLFAEFERVKRTKELFAGGGMLAGHLNCYPGSGARFAYDQLVDQGVIELVRKLSPSQVDRLRVGCNMNLPNSVAQNYHIDGMFADAFLIVNVAVVDTDLVNGAIDVVPRTHKRPYEYWQFALGREYRNSTRLPMQQGDVVVRPSTLWHRGMPNKSARPRPMLAMTFGEASAATSDAFEQDGGKIAFQPNRFRTNWLGRVRERTFVAAPLAHSAIRFVQSVLGKDRYVA